MSQQYTIGTDGKPIYNTPVDEGPTPGGKRGSNQNADDDANGNGNGVGSVLGVNHGIGHGVFAGTNGRKDVVLDFRTLVAGEGIKIDTDVHTLTITSTGTVSNDINEMGGVLSVSKGGTGTTSLPLQALLLGNGSGPVQAIALPSKSNTVLTWNGSNYVWTTPSSTGTEGVTSVAVAAASSKLSVTGGPITSTGTITLDINEANIPINNLNGLLAVTKGGTGAASFITNGVVIGGSSLTSTSAPTGANQTLVWDGSAFTWRIGGTVTSVSLAANSPRIAVGGSTITTTGTFTIDVNEGNLSLPNIGGVLPITKGGTGLTALGTSKQLLRVNAAGNNLEYATLTSSDIWGLAQVATTGAYNDLAGKPNLSTVAVTGNYNDLLNKPTITSGTVTSVAVTAASSKISATGGPITSSGSIAIDVNESAISLNNLSGVLGTTKGGTGRTTLANNGILIGNGTGAVNSIDTPAVAGTVLSWNGATFVWTIPATGGSGNGGTVTSVGLAAGSTKVTVTGSPITSSGSFTVDVNEANLNVANIGGNLIASRVVGLATVATTGSYADLANKPAIPTQYTDAQARASISVSGSLAYNNTTGVISYTAPTLATVATSGNYNDLTNRPTPYVLPTASAIALGGVKIGANLTIDAQGVLSATAGGSGTVTSVGVAVGSSKLSVTGSPVTTSGTITLDVNEANLNIANMTGAISSARVTGLSSVATSGSYNDLINKPVAYALPTASAITLGGIKIGAGLAIDGQGVVSVTATGGEGGTGTGSGTVTSVAVAAGSSKLTVTGSPITTSGTINVDVNEANLNITNMTGSISTARVTGLATVATSGSYSDLTNKPTIPATYTDTQARAAISATGSLSYNSTTGVISYTAPTLAAVATSGSYNDLTNKPTIPSAYTLPTASATVLGGVKIGANLSIDAQGVLSATAAGGGSGTVTSVAVAAGSTKLSVTGSPITSSGTINVDVNEANLNIGNMGGTIAAAKVNGLATVATSGSYADLSNKPTIPAAYTDAQARAAISVSGSLAYNSTTGVISYTAPTLATVATSGSYNDLTNKPTIPAAYTNTQARAAISLNAGTSGATYNSTTGVLDLSALASSGGSGEANTASNVGASGVGVFKAKVGTDLQFKKLVAGSNVTLTDNGDTITVDAAAGSGGGATVPANSTAVGSYTFTSVMNAGNVTAPGLDAATIGISNLPAGWSASCASGVTTITHNIGRPPRTVSFYVGTGSLTNPTFVYISGANTAAFGAVKVAASGSTALNTTTFQYQLQSAMTTVANGTVHIMVTF